MAPNAVEQSIRAAAASLNMEGFEVDAQCVELCRLLLEGKLSMDEYLERVTPRKAG